MKEGFTVAIDGPVASGKGTIAELLAETLHGFHLDTGSMYRAAAVMSLNHGIDPADSNCVNAIISHISIDFRNGKILLGGVDVSQRIREKDATSGSSTIATNSFVRKILLEKQREIADVRVKNGLPVIAEGRDVGTRVFFDSPMKIFLTARESVRAQRRLAQLVEKGDKYTLKEVLQEVKIRDGRDKAREVDPLVSEPEKHGYFVLDNSDLTTAATVKNILEEMKKRKLI